MEKSSVDYSIGTIVEQNKWIIKEVEALKKDVRGLNAWRWKITGFSVAFGAISAAAFEYVKELLNR